ncbi:MAG: hypothetical protein Q8L54_07685 [Devosia sp.]|nr:hypothetical protein [Devosia sp.]
MIRTLNVIMVGTSLIGLIGVYGLKYSVEETASEKVRIERQIERQEADLSMLKADWAYLNQPAHVAPIVARHQDALGLAPTTQRQFGNLDGLPMRPIKEPDALALDALLESLDAGIDPIEQLIEMN